MSIQLIQHNVCQKIPSKPRFQALFFVDIFIRSVPYAFLIDTSQLCRSYFIFVYTKKLESIQTHLEVSTDDKYLKLQFKPVCVSGLNLQLAVRSQRSIIEINNRLQYLRNDNKFQFYKWYLNKTGNLVVQIVYHLEQLLNQLYADHIMGITLKQISELLDFSVSQLVCYLGLQNMFSGLELQDQVSRSFQAEERSLSFADKIKYMALLNDVYKSHRNQPKNSDKKTNKDSENNPPLSKLQIYCKANVLIQSDTAFIESLEKQKEQKEAKLRDVFKIVNPQIKKRRDYLQMSKMHKVQVEFEQYVKFIKKEHLEIYEMTSMHYRIVKGIQNHTLISKQKVLSSEGSHSVIHLGTYSLHLSDTLFTYQYDIKQEESQKKVIIKPLIIKRVKNKQFSSSVNSFKNEIDFLHHVKDKRSKFIATYFLPLDKEKEEVQEIFSEHYPDNLKEYLQKNKNKAALELGLFEVLQVAENILFALIFMVENCVLHRDLKPYNVMIDENLKARVIDFGSCCSVYNANDFVVSQKRILTTPGYQIRYKECSEQLRSKYPRQEYEQHLLYDIYSFGTTLKEMIGYVNGLEQIGHDKNVNVGQVLNIIISKCQSPDPIDRMTFDELLYYIKVIKQIVKKT